jgi:hypothetical protein
MIEATRRKLDEARFFYGHLVKERKRRTFTHTPREFRFYFSAFIQAARSVTWTLRNEEPEKWKAWEPKWKATRNNEEQKLLDLTNELRLDEAKRGGANALVEWEEVALHGLLEVRSETLNLGGNIRRTAITSLRHPEFHRPKYFVRLTTLSRKTGRKT